ncbi:MAG: CAP domain-containing protein, partial [Paracoccaceae bacterium]
MTVPSLTQAKTCIRSGLPASAGNVVPTKDANQALFNSAVLVEVNFQRCRAGIQPLQIASGLITVAGNHASWMAKRGALSHKSTVSGQRSVQERVLASGMNVRRGSENIGNLPRYQFSGSRKIFVNNMSKCDFTTTSGRKIAPHSYSSLATEIVEMWMGSSGHRKNVLDSKVHSVGTALEFD